MLKVFTVAALINELRVGLGLGETGCWVNGRTSLGLRLPKINQRTSKKVEF